MISITTPPRRITPENAQRVHVRVSAASLQDFIERNKE